MKLSPLELSRKKIVERTLEICRWRKSNAAYELSISRPTLDAWIDKYGIKKPRNHKNGKRK